MFKLLFTNQVDLQRHTSASFYQERVAYLSKLHNDGLSIRHLRKLSDLLLVINDMLDLKEGDTFEIPLKTIVEKDAEWNAMSRDQKNEKHVRVSLHDGFLGATKRWLNYLNRLDHRYYPHDNLISRIFPRGFFRVRHLVAPLFQGRLAYLEAQEQMGVPDVTLRRIAQYQLTAIDLLHLDGVSLVSEQEVLDAADIWRDTENPRWKKKAGTESSRKSFVLLTSRWLSFMGLFVPEKEPAFFEQDKVISYLDWLKDHKECSSKTIRSRLILLKQLTTYMSDNQMKIADIKPEDIDDYLRSRHENGCNRRTIAGLASVLRNFFRYASEKGWIKSQIWMSITAPRLYSNETIPSFIYWEEVKEILLESSKKTSPASIRDHAILSLLAMYGLRSSEIAGLLLKDIDWRAGEIRVTRAKSGRPQIIPLVDEVAQPILKYILEVRKNKPHVDNVFTTMRAPFKGIGTSTVYQIASKSLKGRGLNIRHYGPHCYRHSCATKMVNDGHTLKEVGDVLGHVKIDTTSIYAKVNFERLRKVSDMGWEEVLDI